MGEFEGFSAWCMEVIRGDVGFSHTTPCISLARDCVERLERERDSVCDSLCTLIGRGSAGMGVRLRAIVNYCALKVKFTC